MVVVLKSPSLDKTLMQRFGRNVSLYKEAEKRKRASSDIQYSRLEVHSVGRWIWQVHENQYYLGRMIIRLDRVEDGSLSKCTDKEWASLHDNIKAYETLLNGLFQPDRFNYSQMGNVYPQLHVQAVPRYLSSRSWLDRIFSDKNWGKNWAPTPPSPLTIIETYQFALWLRDEISIRLPKK